MIIYVSNWMPFFQLVAKLPSRCRIRAFNVMNTKEQLGQLIKISINVYCCRFSFLNKVVDCQPIKCSRLSANQMRRQHLATSSTLCWIFKSGAMSLTRFLQSLGNTIKWLSPKRGQRHGPRHCDSDQQSWLAFQSRVFEWFYPRDSESWLVVVSVFSTGRSPVRHVFSGCPQPVGPRT